MDTAQSIQNRHSTRKFNNTPISKETILNILDAGRLAPSAKNRQPWHFIVVQGTQKDKIADMMLQKNETNKFQEAEGHQSSIDYTAKIIKQAPVLILVFKKISDDFLISDTLSIGASIENMLLQAEDKGVSSLWIRDTYCIEEEIKDLFNTAPELNNTELVCSVVFGYTDIVPKRVIKKDLDSIVTWVKNE